MDNQEAIEFLKNMIDREAIGFVCPEREGDVAIWQYHVEALQMAISALQWQYSETRKIAVRASIIHHQENGLVWIVTRENLPTDGNRRMFPTQMSVT